MMKTDQSMGALDLLRDSIPFPLSRLFAIAESVSCLALVQNPPTPNARNSSPDHQASNSPTVRPTIHHPTVVREKI
jgi:hypothetical protein